jgi:excisionase family DNA binding protein
MVVICNFKSIPHFQAILPLCFTLYTTQDYAVQCGQHSFKKGIRIVIGDILDANEVAELLRIHPRTVIRLAGKGELPGFKVGDQWRFRREAIEQYIKEQEQRHGDSEKSQ